MSRDTVPTPKKKGRPIEFKQEYIHLVRKLRAQGYSISAFCSYVGIGRKSFYRWKANYPEFEEACDIANEDNITEHEIKLKSIIDGQLDPKVLPAIKESFDRQHGSIKTNDGVRTEINIGNVNMLQNLSEEEFQARLQDKLRVCNLLPPKVINDQGQSEFTDNNEDPDRD